MKNLLRALTLCFAIAASAAHAAVSTVPQSSLSPSNYYYTDLIGGGLGPIAVMTGGVHEPGIGSASGRNDDGYSGPIDLNFTLSFFGQTYTQFWANNNGNISFNGGIAAFIPEGPQGATVPVVSAFFGDVDTRGTASGVLHVRTNISDQIIVTWDRVGYFDGHDDKLNSFQLVLRGPNYVIPEGEGAIGFFYKDMQWDSTDTSTAAAVGFGDGDSNGVVLEGSNEPGMADVVGNHHIWFDANLTPIPSVPEPQTYALMAAGAIALAFALRPRRKVEGYARR